MIPAIFLLFTIPSAQATATPAPPPVATLPPDDAVRREKALALARILAPEALVIGSSDKAYGSIMREALVSVPDILALDREYPGAIDAMIRASQPIMIARARRRLPLLWERLADLYVANFSSAELDQAIGFYAAPAGQKMITLLSAKIKPKAMIDELKKDPEGGVSGTAMMSDIRASVPDILTGMSPAEEAALIVFSGTGAFAKVAAIGPRVQEITANWVNESSPEDDKALDEAMRAALADVMRPKT